MYCNALDMVNCNTLHCSAVYNNTIIFYVLRSCNPAINQNQLDQEPVSVSKSLFLKVVFLIHSTEKTTPMSQVYPFPDYRSDMVVASTTLAIAALVVLVTALVSSRSEHPVDHL